MNVLVVTNMYPMTNDESDVTGIFVKEQVDAIRERSVNVDVFIIKGIKILKYLTAALSLRKKLLSRKYDVVHMHYGLSAIPVLVLKYLGLIRRTRLVLTLHGSDVLGIPIVRGITRIAVAKCDDVVSVSEQIQSIVSAFSNRVHYVPCGIDEMFYEEEIQQNARQERKLVIFPSSPMRKEKNYELFTKVMENVRERYVGDIDIAVVRGMTRTQVRKLLDKATCLLMTSRHEGSPQIVKEAIARDLPVISTDVGDVSSITDGLELCVVSNDFQGLVDGVLSALSSKKVEYSKERKELFKGGKVAEKIVGIYSIRSEDETVAR